MIVKEAETGLGDTMVNEPLPSDVDKQEVYDDVMKQFEEEEKRLVDIEVKIRKRQVLLDKQKALAQRRRDMEAMAWSQKLQIEEQRVAEREEYIELLEKEEKLKECNRMMEQKAAALKAKELAEKLPEAVDDAHEKVMDWMGVTVQDEEKNAVSSRKMELMGSATGAKGGARPKDSSMARNSNTMTDAQKKIKELEAEIARLKQIDPRAAPPVDQAHAVRQLKSMGLMPQNMQEEIFTLPPQITPTDKERQKMGIEVPQAGKPVPQIDVLAHYPPETACHSCSNGVDKSKLKSGKYVKTNVGIKVQEQWPHMNVLRKYCKRVAFDYMDYEAFVAGETRIILQMEDSRMARGRLDLLCKISHWLCRSRDWPLVRGLYEAIIEEVEMGEVTWVSDFSHYENMVPCVQRPESRVVEKQTQKQKEKMEVYWCKLYQKGNCTEKSPHMVQLKPDEPAVPVLHCCAYCLLKENRRAEHAEADCPAKKGQ